MIECTDDWEPPEWSVVLRALRKGTADYARWRPALFRALREIDFDSSGPAMDLGCAEGRFTMVWLRMLEAEGFSLPSHLACVEPERVLLDAAADLIRHEFPQLPLQPAQATARDFIHDPAFATPLSLFVLSHVVYYLSDILDSLLITIGRRLRPRGVGWVIVRDAEASGLYQQRRQLLERHGVVDSHADRFSEFVASRIRALDLPVTEVRRDFMLDVSGYDVQQRHTVFSFLAHLRDVPLSDIASMPPSTWHFSETHFLFHPVSR